MANTSCHLYIWAKFNPRCLFLFYHIEEDTNIAAKKLGGARRQGDKFSAERRNGPVMTARSNFSRRFRDRFDRGDDSTKGRQVPRAISMRSAANYSNYFPALRNSWSRTAIYASILFRIHPRTRRNFYLYLSLEIRETNSRFQDSVGGVFRRLLPRYSRFYGILRKHARVSLESFRYVGLSDLRPAVFTRNVPLPK